MNLVRIFLIMLFLFSFSAYTQIDTDDIEEITPLASDEERGTDPEYSIQELKDKLSTYTKMNMTGKGLLAGGIPLTVVGVVCIVSGISIMVNSYDESGAFLYVLGAYGVGFGVPLMAAGGVLKGIGGGKQKEYLRRLDRVSLRFFKNAVVCEYRF